MCSCRCCVSGTDSCRNTFLVLGLYLKSSIPSGSPARKGREVHDVTSGKEYIMIQPKEIYPPLAELLEKEHYNIFLSVTDMWCIKRKKISCNNLSSE